MVQQVTNFLKDLLARLIAVTALMFWLSNLTQMELC